MEMGESMGVRWLEHRQGGRERANLRGALLALGLLSGGPGARQTAAGPAHALFVPVDLSARYNSIALGEYTVASPSLPEGLAEIRGIPFLLAGGNNVDLTDLGWKYVKEDPYEVWDRYYEPAEIEKGPQRLVLRVPRAYYSRLWVLGAAEDDPAKSPVVSFRVTHYREFGRGGAITATNVSVPAWNAARAAKHSTPVSSVWLEKEGKQSQGRIFLVRVDLPLGRIAESVEDAASSVWWCSDPIPVQPGETYTLVSLAHRRIAERRESDGAFRQRLHRLMKNLETLDKDKNQRPYSEEKP
jgi:hypothetical protein